MLLSARSSSVRAAAALSLALFLVSCEGSASFEIGPPCGRASAPAGCDAVCAADTDCATGLYCDDRRCTTDCLTASDCAGNAASCIDGRCVLTNGDAAVSQSDGRAPDACATLALAASPATPNVTLIVDRSGSMRRPFGTTGESYWDRLKDALINESTGLVTNLESRARFGLTMFTAQLEDPDQVNSPVASPCPLLEVSAGELVAPDINNADAIRSVYAPADFVANGLTPTPETITAMTDRVIANPSEFPEIFVVATDGTPKTCDPPATTTEEQGADATVAAIERAFANGIQTFLVWVGPLDDDRIEANMLRFANAGVGRPADANATFWVAEDDVSLRTALTTITNDQLSCELTLDGELVETRLACEGEVFLNGEPISCDSANGWRALSTNRIELLGSACATYRSVFASVVEARFPCTVLLI